MKVVWATRFANDRTIFVFGYCGIVDFDPGVDSVMFNSFGLNDIFIQKLVGCNSTVSVFNDIDENCQNELEKAKQKVQILSKKTELSDLDINISNDPNDSSTD